jgi:hypothetical protein
MCDTGSVDVRSFFDSPIPIRIDGEVHLLTETMWFHSITLECLESASALYRSRDLYQWIEFANFKMTLIDQCHCNVLVHY